MLLNKRLFSYITVLLLLSGCNEDVQDDFNDVRFELTDQNGNSVIFPDDLKGTPVVMGFIYTHCPDICSLITANLKKIHDEMDEPGSVQYVLVTFDPERDTPAVLRNYAGAFNMNGPSFLFLTGDPAEIDRMMKRMTVRKQISYTKELENGEEIYFINHSDKILLLNKKGQQVMDYGGSMTKPEIIIEDLNKL
ncbi:MAG: SCO family protein [Balneolaceae bacterium]